MNTPEQIDFVVTFVDDHDTEWLALKEENQRQQNIPVKGNGAERYRDWNHFKYWFRSIEMYAPWVHNIFLVVATDRQVPDWVNAECAKLKVVQHEEFIDRAYLPTFNSTVIENNIHNIPGLGEHFVYFNDDMYLCRPAQPSDFFDGMLPRYCLNAKPLQNGLYNGCFAHQLFGALGLINGKFNMQLCAQKHPEKWFSHVYGKNLRWNYEAYKASYLPGQFFTHLPVPFCRSSFTETWKLFGTELDELCRHRFRTFEDVNHMLISLTAIMQGQFAPVQEEHYGKKFGALSIQCEEIKSAFQKRQYLSVCLNDSIDVTPENFAAIKNRLDSILEATFPNHSIFER